MKKIVFTLCFLAIPNMPISVASADNQVVVIPLGGNKVEGNATPADVLKDKTFSSDSGIGIKGTMPISPVAQSGQVRCTYYSGSWHWDDTCTNTTRPPGQDGELTPGKSWPNPRFTDNTDGTVTDNLTGLTWLKDSNCAVFYSGDATGENRRNWTEALNSAAQLSNGQCGLSDGSADGDWRIPTKLELLSLINDDYGDMALSNAAGTAQWTEGDAFLGVSANYFWSSTTRSAYVDRTWIVYMGDGSVTSTQKSNTQQVWPIRN